MFFEIGYFGSDPALENDDWWASCEVTFDTREEAVAYARYLAANPEKIDSYSRTCTRVLVVMEVSRVEAHDPMHIVDFHERIENPAFTPSSDDDSAWRSEIAMQAGMAFGCAGYNDAMGW